MNSNLQAVSAKQLITGDTIVEQPLIFIEDGRVSRVSSLANEEVPEGALHLPDSTLSAGFLDVHVHGAGGRDVMEGSPEAVHTVARVLAMHGTSRFLATTVTASVEHTLRALEGIAKVIAGAPDEDAAKVVGIHLEGPFLSHAKRGVHPPDRLQPPSIELFQRFQQAAGGNIRLMTIAPELPNAFDLIALATAAGVRVSLGHSDAVATEARAGIAAGAVSATHTFNAMRGLTQREPGMLGVVLDAGELYAELICDGVHTTPEAVRLWLKMKGTERALLVTDGMAATGMPDGEYMLGDLRAQVKDGIAMHEGALAGSVLTMDRAVSNVQAFTGCSLADAVRMASRNPEALMNGATETLGAADFNIFNASGQRTGSILRGRLLQA
ncbi:MAG: N-acetylglucosamine-6-phosphate deacetylase [Janthinobacterium lividum]